MNSEKVRAYFDRIGLSMPDNIVPNGEMLKKIHCANALMIPYENIDYLNGNRTPMDPDSVYERIVTGKRGGVCLDINTLLGWFLRELGYNVEELCADNYRDHLEDTPCWHKALKVTDCDAAVWWCDTGDAFSALRYPLRFEPDAIQTQLGEECRFEKYSDGSWILWKKRHGEWKKEYGFTGRTCSDEETYKAKCSGFEEGRMFTAGELFCLKTPFGRRSLSRNIYRESFNGTVFEYKCTDEEMSWAYAQFGLRYPASVYGEN